GSTTPSATLTGLYHPFALAADPSGNLYVANAGIVAKFAPGSTVPGAILAGLDEPFALAVDAAGNLYVANRLYGDAEHPGTVSKFTSGALQSLGATGTILSKNAGKNIVV